MKIVTMMSSFSSIGRTIGRKDRPKVLSWLKGDLQSKVHVYIYVDLSNQKSILILIFSSSKFTTYDNFSCPGSCLSTRGYQWVTTTLEFHTI